MLKLNTDRKTLRKFGTLMAAVFVIFSTIFFIRQKGPESLSALVASCVFLAAGITLPVVLRPLYIIWMHFAFLLSWVNTRIILIIFFYLILTPLGLFKRLLSARSLKNRRDEETYWKKKEKIGLSLSDYERRF